MPSSPNSSHRLFHGWFILGLCTFCQFVAMGFTIYLIGVFIDPLAEAFDTTPGQIGIAAGIFTASGALLSPLLGYFADKGKTRLIMLLGTCLLSAGFLLLSQCRELYQAALICLLMLAPGTAMIGTIPTTVMVAQWFEKRRGLAIGITAAGISTGGFVMPMVAAELLANFSWDTSIFILGCLIGGILLPSVYWIAVVKPADIGQNPDGAAEAPANETAEQAAAVDSMNVKAFLGNANFWLISCAVGIMSFCGILIITYLTPYAKETGMTLQNGALMLSIYSISGVAGKFTTGWLCDKLPPRRMLAGTLLMAACGWLPIIFSSSTAAFMVTACSVGFAMGGLIPVWSTLIAEIYGMQNFGRVRGLMSLVTVVFTVIPGPLGGYLRDTSGTYLLAFEALWWLLPVGVIAALLVGRNKRPPLSDDAVAQTS